MSLGYTPEVPFNSNSSSRFQQQRPSPFGAPRSNRSNLSLRDQILQDRASRGNTGTVSVDLRDPSASRSGRSGVVQVCSPDRREPRPNTGRFEFEASSSSSQRSPQRQQQRNDELWESRENFTGVRRPDNWRTCRPSPMSVRSTNYYRQRNLERGNVPMELQDEFVWLGPTN